MSIAPPTLALHLLDQQAKLLTPKIGTGCHSIDCALQGGLSYGQIAAIEGANGTGKTLIAIQVLTTHLLSSSTARAVIIDTRGIHSPPYLLRDVVRARLSGDMEEVEEVLERVLVMRVFDVWGLCEGVEEVGRKVKGEDAWGERMGEPKEDRKEEQVLEVADSEGEDSDISNYDIKTNPQKPNPPSTILLVDLLTSPFTTQMQSSPTTALSLLHTLLRTLHHLTTSHHLLVILLNSSYPTNSTAIFPTNPSIFSTTGPHYHPALGRSFGYCIDTRVLLSKVPRRGEDVEDRVLGRGEGREVGVLEVVGERNGGRGGRWGCWECMDGVSLRDAFPQNT